MQATGPANTQISSWESQQLQMKEYKHIIKSETFYSAAPSF